MTSRVTSWCVLLCVVVLAGCGAAPPTATVTPAPVPDTPSPTGTPAAATSSLPAGITETGIRDPFVLAHAHRRTLNRSYTVRKRYSVRPRNGSSGTTKRVRVAVASDHRRYLARIDVETAPTAAFDRRNLTLTTYSNGTAAVRRVEQNGATSVRVVREPDGDVVPPYVVPHGRPLNDARIATLLSSLGNVSVTPDPANGTYRLTATRLSPTAVTVGGIRIRNASLQAFTAVVTQAGLVRTYHLTLLGTHGNASVVAVEHVRYTAVGRTTVDSPPWVAIR